MSIILSKKLEDEVLKDNFPSSFSIEPENLDSYFLCSYTKNNTKFVKYVIKLICNEKISRIVH